MNPIAKAALERASMARMVLSREYVDATTPVGRPDVAPAPVSAPTPIAAPAPEEAPEVAPIADADADTDSDEQAGGSRSLDKFVVRLPEGMRAQISVRAKKTHYSMNSVVIRAVENELANHEEHRLMMEGLALLKQQLQEALAAAQGGQQ
jgi:hypothetical protein